jgi:ubiquinone/menaquinone biosynthesis C-methylase UbiE
MSAFYDKFFATFYDRALAATEKAGLADRRKRLIAQASGETLEIGAGTGANVALYPPAVTRLVLTEPSGPMASHIPHDREFEFLNASALDLPFDDDSFDTAVSTLVLCTVPDEHAALAELHRVLRPGGKLLLLEHVRSENPGSAAWQDRFETPWRLFANGCRCNRDTASAVREAGFEFEELEHGTVPKAMPVMRPLIQGVAVAG